MTLFPYTTLFRSLCAFLFLPSLSDSFCSPLFLYFFTIFLHTAFAIIRNIEKTSAYFSILLFSLIWIRFGLFFFSVFFFLFCFLVPSFLSLSLFLLSLSSFVFFRFLFFSFWNLESQMPQNRKKNIRSRIRSILLGFQAGVFLSAP